MDAVAWPRKQPAPANDADDKKGTRVPQNTATTSNVASSATAVTLFAAGTGQDTVGRIVVNDSTSDLFLKYGSGASATSYTTKIAPGGYWEAPAPVYDGLITGIWTVANGNARCTQVDL